ncbi:MAG TPA: hypothetical protein VM536_05920 [Chloroflexia bacterium]|nr:hypothetical protein [Chloroflexia bacterium]
MTYTSRRGWRVLVAAGLPVLLSGAVAVAGSLARPLTAGFADPAFQAVWQRTDLPVADHTVARTWFWGPAPGGSLSEVYDEGPGHIHQVQYFDKSRMEINNPKGDPGSKWYVTNGLLSIEMISGRVQLGNGRWLDKTRPPIGPATIPLASDIDDTNAPTYASFTGLANTPLGDHKAADRTNQSVIDSVSRAGAVTQTPDKGSYAIRYARFEPLTGHNIAGVFWNFLTSRGPVRENGATREAQISDPWFFTSGLPISEAYWARVKIAGAQHDVLIQCFERRVLTYIPDYPPEWRVQMANIGQHYVQWRYEGGLPPPQPTAVNPLFTR